MKARTYLDTLFRAVKDTKLPQDTRVRMAQGAIQGIHRERQAFEEFSKKCPECPEDALPNPPTSLDTTDEKGYSPLYYAAEQGNHPLVRALLDGNASINANAETSASALAGAILAYQTQTVELLIQKNADLSLKDKQFHFTPLMHAATQGKVEIMKLLLKAQASVDVRNANGNHLLTLAATKKSSEVIRILLDAKIDPNTIDKEDPPLCVATGSQQYDTVKMLLEFPEVLVDIRNKGADTPLMLAAWKGHPMLEDFLHAGANLFLVNKDNYTALDLAIQNKQVNAVCTLLNYGAVINNFPAFHEAISEPQFSAPAVYNFCLGVSFAQQGFKKAEAFLNEAIKHGNSSARRYLGEIYEKKGNLTDAVRYYKDAAKAGEKRSLSKLVAITQKLVGDERQIKGEQKAANISLAAFSFQPKQVRIVHSESLNNLTDFIYSHIIFVRMSVYLTVMQWNLLAVEALGNNYFQQRPLHGFHFAFKALEKAKNQARETKDQAELQGTSIMVRRLFFQPNEQLSREQAMLRKSQLELLRTIDLIMDYCENDYPTQEVLEDFFANASGVRFS